MRAVRFQSLPDLRKAFDVYVSAIRERNSPGSEMFSIAGGSPAPMVGHPRVGVIRGGFGMRGASKRRRMCPSGKWREHNTACSV